MIPIYVDFIVSFAATVAGFVVLVSKMDVFDRRAYTPILESMIIFIGSLGWSVFALLSFAAVTRYPPWLTDDNVWTGSWGYTTARVLWSVAWVLLLLLMTRYTAYMQHRKQYKD